jgi:hypothetical protein
VATINLDFIADISQATKQVADFTKKAETQFDGLSKTFKTIGLAAAGAFAAIGVGFSLKKAISEASAFEVEVNRLKTALELSGITTEQATKEFLDYASALQRTTTFSDDAVLSTASLIQSISKLPTDQLQRATKAALDLSTALRIDLNTASRLVAKAAEGNVDAFRRYGIQIQKGKDNTETFANALTALESKFGGSSERAVNTFSGAISQLQNAANDSLKAFGGFIIQSPEVIQAIQTITSGFVKLTEAISNNEGFVQRSIKAFASFISDLDGRKKVYDEISASVKKNEKAQIDLNDAVDVSIQQAKAFRSNSALKEQNEALVASKKAEENRAKLLEEAKKQFQQTQSAFTSLESKFKTFNLDPVQAEINQTTQNLADLERARRAGIVNDSNYQNLRLKIQEDGDKRVLDAQKKKTEAELKAVEESNKKIADTFQTIISSVRQGSAGTANLAAFGAGQAANVLAPGTGGAVSEAVSFLTQDPELVRAQLQGFIDGIPIIIDNFVANVPLIIDVLAANSPKIATSLAALMPVVSTRLAIELVKQSPNIARSFANALISEAGRIAQSVADGVKDALGKVTGGVGSAGGIFGSISGAVGGIGKRLRFADGGEVPGGAPFTDRIPALLTPGEYVLSRDDVKNLVTNSEKQAAPTRTTEMVTINLQIGQEKLASVIYDLSKRGFRLA